MSFGLSREECAQLVAREGYEKHCREDNQRHSAWENLPHDARERWLDFGRHVMAVVGPSVALETLLDAKAQIVVKTPEIAPDYVRQSEKAANEWTWATARASYENGVAATVEKFTTALKTKIWNATNDQPVPATENFGDLKDRVRREAFAEVETWIDAAAGKIMDAKTFLADEEAPNV